MTTFDSRESLRKHVASGHVDLAPAPEVFDRTPPALTGPDPWPRLEGMLLGLMIGDSLGNTSESQLPHRRFDAHGEIRNYLPHHRAGGREVGLPSDDTQLAMWTLESMLEQGGVDSDALAKKFCSSRIFGIGSAVREFVGNYKDEGLPWHEAGARSAGNGALMRIAPVLLPHVRNPTPALWSDAAIAATLTHNDRASTGSCVAFIAVLWDLLGMDEPPAPEWWLERFIEVLKPLEGGDTHYRSRIPGDTYDGPLWAFLEQRLPDALARDLDARTAGNSWYSGAYLLETVPTVLYILMRHGHDAEEAIVRAVNDARDNDTVAAIVGAAVGALHGTDAIPIRWREGLLGRTREQDDGHAFELMRQAQARWVAR
ncbi:MAG: ADP-ribosylglycohydrolase family protein [Gemmatimonadaceae bacterium]|nr:ADP-ribosylglycohydrolase family protein [Gemmatimonadaceae bacterium]